jgi:LysM repeat protein
MDVLTNKSYKQYAKLSRYSPFPHYYHTLDGKYVTGTDAYLKDDTAYTTYVVKKNDTIQSIASKYNTSPEVIYQINGYSLDLVPGNIIFLPKINSNYFDYYVVSKGDTLYNIASNNKIDVNLLAQLNGINKSDYIYPNQTLLIPKSGSILYFTAVGDTLSEIAKGLNVSVDKLISQNENIYLQPEQLIVYKYN